MLITPITDNFYQLTDVFSPSTLDNILRIFDADKDTWSTIPQTNGSKRLQFSLSINDAPGTDIYKELTPAFSTAESTVGRLYQNGPQLWYDSDAYINEIHDGDVSPNHCVNIQVYLANGNENMGTYCYDNDTWHGVPYRYNCGYMLIGPTRIPHGMKHPVAGERLSLYQGFRNTEIPSDIW